MLERASITDGTIIVSPLCSGAKLLAASRIRPLVLVNRRERGLAAVLVDNREAAHLAVDHLPATAHTRVTYADGHPDSWVANVRWRAILERAAEHGMAAHRIVDARARLASRPLADLLDELGGAVIVHSERFAKDAIRHLRGLGASVPGDACVVSFDDLPRHV